MYATKTYSALFVSSGASWRFRHLIRIPHAGLFVLIRLVEGLRIHRRTWTSFPASRDHGGKKKVKTTEKVGSPTLMVQGQGGGGAVTVLFLLFIEELTEHKVGHKQLLFPL